MKGLALDPSHFTVLSGAGAILDHAFWCLTEQGDGARPAAFCCRFLRAS